MALKVAIIGSRGIPAKYGGFETFVDEISKRLVAKVHVHRPSAVTLNETPEEFHISTGLCQKI